MLGFEDRTQQELNRRDPRLGSRRASRSALTWLIIPSACLTLLAPQASAAPSQDGKTRTSADSELSVQPSEVKRGQLTSDSAARPASTPAARAGRSATEAAQPSDAAHDSSTDDRQVGAARAHFFRGVKYYESGDFRWALLEFRRAFDLSHNYRILYNLGRVNHELNQYANAIEAYQAYLSAGGSEIEADRRADIERDLETLRARTASLTITVSVAGAEVLVDNRAIGKAPLAAAIRLDAGEHFITTRLQGYRQQERRIVVASGDAASEEFDLEALKLAVQPDPSQMPSRLLAPPPPSRTQSHTFTTIAWISTGTLALGAGATGALAWNQAEKLAKLRDTPGSSADERSKLQSRGKILATTSDVLTAAAIVAGGTALYLTIRGRNDDPASDGVARLGLDGPQVVFSYSR